MELIIAENLSFHSGSKDILKDGSFRILEGQKVGLIGANGSGKTTLIRMILGELEADGGRLKIKPGLKTGYVPQQPDYDEDQSIEDFLISDLAGLLEAMNAAAEKMSAGSSAWMDEFLTDYQRCSDDFEAGGGYEALERGETYLRRLGLDNPMNQKMGSLSGGERSLVFFASALLSSPELLILDEPGNHLDYLGLAWLETFIAGFKGAVIIVSHNRYLLDSTCGMIIAMEKGKLSVHKGNYSAYKVDRYRFALKAQSDWEASRKLIDKLEKRIKELQSIAMNQYNPPATVMSQLGAAKTKLEAEKTRGLTKPELDNDAMKLNFGIELSKSNIALQIKDLNIAFGDRVLFNQLGLEINCGEKVALVGANGSGKTTLINTVLKQGQWHNPSLRIGPSQKIGYLSQTAVFSETAVTIEDEIRSWGPLTRDGAFSIAGNFAFEYGDLEKPLSVLSGGEVNRLQLARLMYEQINFLILDEPTNHMDIQSREAIEQAIAKFKGTVLVISHDRYFLDQLVDRVVEIENGMLVSHPGNFSDYFKKKYPVLPRLSGDSGRRGLERRKSASGAGESVLVIERRIEELESEKLELERELEASFSGRDRKTGLKAAAKLDKLSIRLVKLYAEWEASAG
ncbi:MAG: ABC-F family ATP-binding cassette domain-containing protein [Spirochaetales bacterium]|nr:ABC-F family ATP-binding cassette domain-containing protein [Spirochaetales bacterium]